MANEKVIKLERWAFTNAPAWDGYTPPELAQKHFKGHVYDHPRREDGEYIRTSVVTKIEGRIVHTQSGSVYRLGEVDPKYKEWLDKEGYLFDPENPVAFHKRAPRKAEA